MCLIWTLAISTPCFSFGAEATLSWSANSPKEDVKGYKIYFGGESRYDSDSNLKATFQYDFIVDLNSNLMCPTNNSDNCVELTPQELSCVNLDTCTPSCTLKNLNANQLYYFTSTAFNDSEESNYSAEANFFSPKTDIAPPPLVGEMPDTPAPFFSTAAFPNGGGIMEKAYFDHDWAKINHMSNMKDPVVIVGPSSFYDPEQGTVRLQNISTNSFEIKFQEGLQPTDNSLPHHDFEESSYMILEKGVHYMDDGSIWEVGTFELENSSDNTQWKTKSFSADFEGVPYLFLTMQTSNSNDTLTVRVRNISNLFFQAAIFKDSHIDGHSIEKIGYLALHSPNNIAGELNGPESITQYRLEDTTVSQDFTSTLGRELSIQIGHSVDDLETQEIANSLLIDNNFFSQVISCNASGPISARQRPSFYSTIAVSERWYTVPMTTGISSPVVIVGPPSYNNEDPGVVRINNISATSFDIRFEEWLYLNSEDGRVHPFENVSWLTLEPGLYHLMDGSIWEVGTFQINGTKKWHNIHFGHTFQTPPALFLTIQTYNESQPVTIRSTDIDTYSFKAALFEEEANMQSGHSTETVGYLAIHSPTLSGTASINEQNFTYNINYINIANRFESVSNYKIALEEEQSRDEESSHTTEIINTLTINNSFFAQDISTKGNDTISLRFLHP